MLKSLLKTLHIVKHTQKCYLCLTAVHQKINTINLEHIRNPVLNKVIVIVLRICILFWFIFTKGLAFSIQERKSHGLYGLLPPVVLSLKDQERLVLDNLNRLSTDLDRYVYLMNLADRYNWLFYHLQLN